MNTRTAKLLLATIISVRASAYLFSKLLLESMGPFTLIGIRFLIAFALLAVLFRRRFAKLTRQTLCASLAIGTAFFAAMGCELTALQTTSSSTVSFLENTAIVLVPVAAALMTRTVPGFKTVVSAAVALVGVGFLTLGQGGFEVSFGEIFGIGSAVFYTAAMLATDRFAKNGDALLIGILQVGWIGTFGLVCSLLLETPCLPATNLEWLYVGVLAVVCTGFGFTLQPIVQRPLSVNDVGLMCAINPLVATSLGVAVLSEPLDAAIVTGMALVIAAIIAPNIKLGRMQSPEASHQD